MTQTALKERPLSRPPAEFDSYVEAYPELLRDPVRERFAPGGRFFIERKRLLLKAFLQGAGVAMQRARWLDIGCGRGDLLAASQSEFRYAAGCDLSAGMIAGAKGLDVRLQNAPDQLPFDDGSFDLLTAVCVYHHVDVEVRARLTTEAARVLRPGGIFCVMEHNPFNPVTRFIVRRSPVDANAELLSAGEVRRLVRVAGMQVLRTQYFLLFPEFVYQRLAWLEAGLSGLPLGGQYAVFGSRP
ncbi:MAG TPA: class I SAM-dependent methyltransferase [Bryobacterales bacterium]|jgi:SAM-dependent methyltransferase|nr:class I SAM-dependent methyltransferase [Bryobacterales bacterium]